MKGKILKISALVAMLSMSASSFAETYHNITIKTGSFTLSDANQIIDATPVIFETSSNLVFAIEYELRLRNNTTFGGELISYKNNFSPFNSKANATHVFANFKKYFDVAQHVHPFIGVGAGGSGLSLSGGFSGTGSGFGVQFLAGVKFPFEEVSMVIEYKVIDSEPSDDFGSSVDLSGDGLFAGLAINF